MKNSMIVSVLLLLSSLCATAQVAPKEGSEKSLSFAYLPLLDGNAGGVRIAEVPTFSHGYRLTSYIDAMMTPTFAASADEEGRGIDINLVSRSRIVLRLENLSDNREVKLVFDLSKAELPAGVHVSLVNIVEAALTCLRLQFPPELLTRMEIEYIGVPAQSKVNGLGSRLWPGMP